MGSAAVCAFAALLPAAAPAVAADAAAEAAAEAVAAPAAITHVVPSPDGKQVAYVSSMEGVDGGAGVLWVQLVDHPDAPRRLSPEGSRARAPAWSPDGRWLAWLADAGDGRPTLVRAPADGVTPPRPLAAGDYLVEAFRFSPAGNGVAFVGTRAGDTRSAGPRPVANIVGQRTPSMLWWLALDDDGAPGAVAPLSAEVVHVPTAAPAAGTPAAGFDVSPDGRQVVFTHTTSSAPAAWKSADLSVVDVHSGRVRSFQRSDAAEFAPRYAPDGRHVAFSVTVFPPSAPGQWRVAVTDAAGQRPKLLAVTPDEQPHLVGWTSNRSVLVAERDGTLTALWNLPRGGGEARRFDDGASTLSAIELNAAGTRLGFAIARDDTPDAPAFTPLRKFRPAVLTAAAPVRAAPPTRLLTWHSRDGTAVEGLLTLPPFTTAARHPLVVMLHPEPAGVFQHGYPGTPGELEVTAALALAGYGVLRPNLRGASGYGHRFRALDVWGGADYEDLMAAVDHLVRSGLADPERLAVMGWGHGGFLAALTITRTHRFGAAILGAPITDLLLMSTGSEHGHYLADYLGGGPDDDELTYRALSPLPNAYRITTPTLILHGESDQRVDPLHGLALYRALDARGLPSRMVLYPAAGHQLLDPAQRRHARDEVLAWLERHLSGAGMDGSRDGHSRLRSRASLEQRLRAQPGPTAQPASTRD